ncbi:hypothetical protein Tco_0245971 [Tanacetum coccineum]
MQETNNRNQEASSQLMQNQMGQIVEAFQERPSCVLPSDTETYPREEHKAVTTMDGLTLAMDSESLFEETDTLLSQIDDSFLEYETFCFNIEENSSGSTTSHSDLSLPDYEVFCFEEKSSGSTTSHSNHSLPEYESFCFDHMKEKSGGSTTTHLDFLFLNMIRLSLIF